MGPERQLARAGTLALAAEERGTAPNGRLTGGGLARGSMKAQTGDLGSKRCEAYGADLDGWCAGAGVVVAF